MKNTKRGSGAQGGFILKLMLVVVGVCVAFVVLSTLARNFTGIPTISNGAYAPSASSGAGNGNNQLLKFLDNAPGASYGSYGSYGSSGGASDIPAAYRSPYAGTVSLGAGNAGYSIQPFEEYVTLRNSGDAPVTVTGWTLTNGKGTRPIQTSQNDYLYPVADSATIGQGTELLDPSGNFTVGPIVLKPGDTAIVTTGRPFTQFPFSITTSFRENICEGYLKYYPFQPVLNQSCPVPTDDPAIRTVTDECYDYMSSLNRCQDPKRYDKANYDMQTAQCRAFMDARLSYPACVANTRYQAGFSLKQWRIFLGKGAELWADRRETITLYDSKGLIVDQISY
ncbi:MAG TPA: hypothetical protein VFQ72_00055 [Candidatus Paceibacterota bacterium]|nr:hypothetical protein [Candidatus Paceibacterota bacterium]